MRNSGVVVTSVYEENIGLSLSQDKFFHKVRRGHLFPSSYTFESFLQPKPSCTRKMK